MDEKLASYPNSLTKLYLSIHENIKPPQNAFRSGKFNRTSSAAANTCPCEDKDINEQKVIEKSKQPMRLGGAI